jgi:tyrosyl-tRNA synthetase
MKTKIDLAKIKDIMERGVQEIIDKEHFYKALTSGRKLRVKFGIDPTSPDLHLGHSIALQKLRQMQELGHQVIFLIGDFTAQIGDPSGKSSTRRALTAKEVQKNMKEYAKQAQKILDLKKVQIRYNSEWYSKKGINFIIDLLSKFTFARLIERDDFQKRLKADQDIAMHELIYPLLQGYDSVALKADLEIGGSDQKFNFLCARKVQKRYNMPQQDIMTLSLLLGTDGVHKMSKSLGNYIKITEEPAKMFGQIMSIPDELMWHYFSLLTDLPLDDIEEMKENVQKNILPAKQAKVKLALEIVTKYHNSKQAQKAKDEFERVFKRKELPAEIPVWKANKKEYNILELLQSCGLCASRSEAKRMVLSKAVEIDNNEKNDWKENIVIRSGMIIRVGKRKFIKII